MSVLAALLAGGGIGTGLWLIGRGIAPRRPSLTDVWAEVHRPRWDTAAPSGSWVQRSIDRLAAAVAAAGVGERAGLSQDLAVIGKSRERLALERLSLAVTLLALPLAFASIVALAGIGMPWAFLLIASAVAAAVGFAAPGLMVGQAAKDRRREFRWAVAGFVDLVTIQLAGGEGVETALRVASVTGAGWPFQVIAEALTRANRHGVSSWAALSELAQEMAVPELAELASSATLAGDSGARIRQSLAAKAVSMRDHELATELAEAESQSERLGVPVVALLVGFVLLIGYPAVARVMAF